MPLADEVLKKSEARYEELNMLMSDPAVVADTPRYVRLVKEFTDLEPLVHDIQRIREIDQEIEENKLLITESDEHELRELAHEEIATLEDERRQKEEAIRLALIPKDPLDEKNVIVEIRAGTGGEEAALFVADLTRMYMAYAEKNHWDVETIDSNETELGGFKEIVFSVDGKNAYSKLKFESGTHRVQRVPETESGGRIHTSAVTVAVLPEADEVDVDINPNDIKVDIYRSSGAGGQHVNKTSSAIRVTHLPTGIVVTCQDERSQHKNRDRAMSVLRSRLLELKQSTQDAAIAADRKAQVGSGDRSERIRTYNFPQSRVTDHRIGLTLYQLDQVLAGDLDPFIDALTAAAHEKKLGAASNE